MASVSSSSLPVAQLYVFGGSCFASAALLCLKEKGYGEDDCIVKSVDLLSGANFDPNYLKINTAGTVPTLVVPQLRSAVDPAQSTKFTSLTSTVEILEFLDSQRGADSRGSLPARSLAPGSISIKERDDTIIALTQSPDADPNFALLSAKTKEELEAKGKGVPGAFVNGRKKALEGYLKQAEENPEGSGRLVNFYKSKLEAMNGLSAIYSGSADSTEFLSKGASHWSSLARALATLSSLLPREDRSGFITLMDLHAGAWFARILACVGASDLKDVDGAFEKLLKSFEKEGLKEAEVLGLKNWWKTMVIRKSFEEVYADGLH